MLYADLRVQFCQFPFELSQLKQLYRRVYRRVCASPHNLAIVTLQGSKGTYLSSHNHTSVMKANLKIDWTATMVLQSDSVSSSPALELSLLTMTMLSARLMPASSRSSKLQRVTHITRQRIRHQRFPREGVAGAWHTVNPGTQLR